MRIGNGFDAHKLIKGRDLILGGIKVPFEMGLLGHSDADVLTHAIMDSLLGAIGEGDIGVLFPDSDDTYKGISSIILLKEVGELVKSKGYEIEYIDSVIMAEKPKLSPYLNDMRCCISDALFIDKEKVNIKATTTEGMGFTGRAEGMAALSTCLLK